jgi:hypothetical protein
MAQRAGGRSSVIRQGRTTCGGASAGPLSAMRLGRGMPPARGGAGSCEPLARMDRSSPSRTGGAWASGVPTHGLCRPGRAVSWLCFAVAQVFAFLPYSSRREQRGEGAGLGAWAHARGGERMLLVARLPAQLPGGERRGYQSRKGRFRGCPALEGSERAVGAGLFRHVGGRCGLRPDVSGAGPYRYGSWLAQAEG